MKTYTQKVHYRFVVEGDYSVADLWEEDLYQNPEDAHDNICDYLMDNPFETLARGELTLTNLRTEEEN